MGTCWPNEMSVDGSACNFSFRAILASTMLGIVPVSISRVRPFSRPMDPLVTIR
jgi:hypothetical protein